MNILITGANGFIGRALTELMLSKGHNVFAIVTSERELEPLKCDKLHVFKLFFEDYPKIAELVQEDIDVVYHFAWHGLIGDEAIHMLQNITKIKLNN